MRPMEGNFLWEFVFFRMWEFFLWHHPLFAFVLVRFSASEHELSLSASALCFPLLGFGQVLLHIWALAALLFCSGALP